MTDPEKLGTAIIGFLNSPFGMAAPMLMFGVLTQHLTYKGMALNKATRPKVDDFVSEVAGYSVTTILGVLLFALTPMTLEIFILDMAVAIAGHVGWARWLEPKLRNKAKGKT